MARNPQSRRVILLGASGLLGRMVTAVWRESPPQDFEIAPVFRTPVDDPGALVWTPGQNAANLPQVDAIVALWGIKPGSGLSLGQNAALAIAAQQLGCDLGASRVLHASSAAVYRAGPDPLSETASLIPATAYGAAKLEMEAAIARWHVDNPGGPETSLMRIGNVAGADSLFLNLARGGPIRLDRFPDGRAPARSYVAPHDLAGAILALLRSDLTGPVNVSAPMATGMDHIARAAGAEIDWVDAPDDALPRVQLDSGRLQALYDFGKDSADAGHLVDSARATGVWP